METSLYFWKESNVKRACEAKLTPLSVDFETKTGVFPSSRGAGTYVCTLESCPCGDFSINRKPCKHMIRLAHELHVITLPNMQTSADDAHEKDHLSKVDAFVKNAPLPDVVRAFKTITNLNCGVVVSDEDIRFVSKSLPFFLTPDRAYNPLMWSVYKSMSLKLNNRFGLLLTKYISDVPQSVLDAIFFLDDPSYSVPHPASKVKECPDIAIDALLDTLSQKEIAFKDLRSVSGCLWIESTVCSDTLLKGVTISGKHPVCVASSRHFGNRRAWYIK